MTQHKIQSSTGLTLELEQVPKMLGKLTKEWAPRSFVVSFKLETDEQILFQKAGGALKSYGVHLVVANLLQNRADVCYLVAPITADTTTAATNSAITSTDGVDSVENTSELLGKGLVQITPTQKEVVVSGRTYKVRVLQREASETQIEPLLVHYVALEYNAYLCNKKQSSKASTYCANWLSPIKDSVREYVDLVTCAVSEHDSKKSEEQCVIKLSQLNL